MENLQKKIQKIIDETPKYRKEQSTKALEADRGFGEQGTYWAPVSGRRRRKKKINYIEIDLT